MSLLVKSAALSGAVAVIAGAFGAHGAGPQAAGWLRTGSDYALIHALAAIVALRLGRSPLAAALLLGGSIVFAATLYAMAVGAPRWLGAVTPLGGAAMILGWLVLALKGR